MRETLRSYVIEQESNNEVEMFEKLRNLWSTAGDPVEYREDGSRISNWIPPEGFEFRTFVEDGMNYELLKPEHANGKYVLMIHGGGYTRRMKDCFITMMPFYSEAAGFATVLNVDYRVVPEVKCTQIVLDVIKGYQKLLNQGVSGKDIIMIGDSSGGGTVLSTLLYMRDHGMELPAGTISLSGSLDLGLTTESSKTNSGIDLCFHDTEVLQKIYDSVLAGEDFLNPYISPYYGDFHDLSPIMLVVGDKELLLDDSIHTAQLASNQGVETRLEIFKGMFHDFVVFRDEMKEAQIAWEHIHEFMEECFNKG